MSRQSPARVGQDGKTMLLVPEDWFLMGTGEADIADMCAQFGWDPKWFADEMPQHRVYLDAFYMDATPVTNAEYKRFIDANPDRPAPPDWDRLLRTFVISLSDHPVVNVAWADANAYAQWVGKRLPTEAEWEKAARGTDARRFPWGDRFEFNRCNTKVSKIGGTTAVAKYAPQGQSPYAVLDLAGNVWEWCADWYAAETYRRAPTHNPRGPETGDWRVLRGGAWDLEASFARCASRDYIAPENGYATVGFRCVMQV